MEPDVIKNAAAKFQEQLNADSPFSKQGSLEEMLYAHVHQYEQDGDILSHMDETVLDLVHDIETNNLESIQETTKELFALQDAVKAADLPSSWHRYEDPESKVVSYWNDETTEAWQAVPDEASGMYYYWNPKTSVMTFDIPSSLLNIKHQDVSESLGHLNPALVFEPIEPVQDSTRYARAVIPETMRSGKVDRSNIAEELSPLENKFYVNLKSIVPSTAEQMGLPELEVLEMVVVELGRTEYEHPGQSGETSYTLGRAAARYRMELEDYMEASGQLSKSSDHTVSISAPLPPITAEQHKQENPENTRTSMETVQQSEPLVLQSSVPLPTVSVPNSQDDTQAYMNLKRLVATKVAQTGVSESEALKIVMEMLMPSNKSSKVQGKVAALKEAADRYQDELFQREQASPAPEKTLSQTNSGEMLLKTLLAE